MKGHKDLITPLARSNNISGEIYPLVQDIFLEKFSCDLEKGIKVTKTNQGFDIPKLQVW